MSPLTDGRILGASGEAAAPGLLHHKDTVSISSSQRVPDALTQRRKMRLEIAVDWIVARHGYECTGFLTITFPENLTDWAEAEKRWASFEKNVLSRFVLDWAMVVQVQKRGAIHYHVIVGLPSDIRTGTNIKTVKNRDLPRWMRYSRENVSSELRRYWDEICQRAQGRRRLANGEFDKVSEGYGIGRVELMPLEKEPIAVSRYMASYLQPGVDMPEGYKHKKKLRFSRTISSWLSANFQANTFGAFLWRKKLQTVARDFGIESYGDMAEYFGPRWFYILRDAIRLCPLQIDKEDWKKGIGERLYAWRLEQFDIEAKRGWENKDRKWLDYVSAKERAWERFEEDLKETEERALAGWEPPNEVQCQLCLMYK